MNQPCKQSGVAKLRLIDFDQVTLSSLNRHATATRADVGIPKVRSVQRFLHSVVPWVNVDTCMDLWSIEAEQSNHWLEGADWVVDAIDNISTKVRINNLKMDQFQLRRSSFCSRSTFCHVAILKVSALSPRWVPEPRWIHHAFNPRTSAAQPTIP
jgi:hypothetical protein